MIKQPGEPLGEMDISYDKNSNTVDFTVWVKGGMGIINREYLDVDDPRHPYNLIAMHGLVPESFGIAHPISGKYINHTNEQLINEIVKLQKYIIELERAGLCI